MLILQKKIFSLFFLFLLIVAGCKEEKNKKLIVGLSPDYPPFAFEYRNTFIGFDVELIDAICARLGYEVEFKKMNFQDLFLALENKNVDLVASAVTQNLEREKKFDFSHSYYKPTFALVYKRENAKQIHSIGDVEGIIGVEKGTTMEYDISHLFQRIEVIDSSIDELKNNSIMGLNNDENKGSAHSDNKDSSSSVHANIAYSEVGESSVKGAQNAEISEVKSEDEQAKTQVIKLYDSHRDLLHGLEKDEISAIFVEILQAEVATQNDRDLTYIPITQSLNEGREYHYGFVFNKNSKLLEKFNKALDEMESEGKIDILRLRWFSGYGMYNDFGKD